MYDYETRFVPRPQEAPLQRAFEEIAAVDQEMIPHGWSRVWTDHTGGGAFVVYRRARIS
jgi:hypothetical protein